MPRTSVFLALDWIGDNLLLLHSSQLKFIGHLITLGYGSTFEYVVTIVSCASFNVPLLSRHEKMHADSCPSYGPPAPQSLLDYCIVEQ